MNISQNLFFLFLIIFILEIYLFITVGSAIGVLSTISLVILTAIIGIFILRIQGIMTLQKLQTSVNHGEAPTEALLYGILLLIGGALLLTPGFFTDVLGLTCVIPITRKPLISYFMSKIQPATTYSSSSRASSNTSTADSTQATKKQKKKKRRPMTIEGEYRRED